MRVGILHPGAMGAPLAGVAVAPVMWASEGRSLATVERATEFGLVDQGSVANLVAATDTLISVCPPHAAMDVAIQVAGLGFDGLYVDANAVAALWAGSTLDTRVLDGEIGSASALKVAYAGWTKGSTALLLGIRAYAEANGLGDDLVAEWETSIPGLADRVERTAGRIGRKAWRFEGEMAEISAAMEDVGLPGGFHDAAREIYARLADLKTSDGDTVDDVNRELLES